MLYLTMKKKCFFLSLLIISLSSYTRANSSVFYKVDKDTATSRFYLDLGIETYKEKKYKEALSYFEEAIKNDEGNWKAYSYKGDVEFDLKKYKESVDDYTKALSINKSDALSYKGRGEAYRMMENWQGAIKDYTIASQMGSNDVVIYFQSGYCNDRLKNYKESIENHTKSINILSLRASDSNKWLLNMSYIRRGSAYLNYGKYRESINDFNKYLNLRGDDPYFAYSQRGRAYLYLSQIDSALIDFNNVLKKFPNNAVLYKFFGMVYSLKMDTSNARRNFNISIKLNSNDPENYFYWAQLEIDYRNYYKAVELLETVLQKLETEPSFDLYFRLGWAKAGTGDTLGAITAFDKAVAKDSNRYELYELRTAFLSNSKLHIDQLIKDYTSMIRLAVDTNVVTNSLRYETRSFLKLASADLLGARKDIDKAIEILPTEPIYYVLRTAVNYYLTDDKELMLKDLDKAISLDNSLWEAYLWKVAIYERYKVDNKYVDSDLNKTACENLKKGIKNGAKVSAVIENYICKGKLPKDEILPNDMLFSITPKFKNKGLKDIQQKK